MPTKQVQAVQGNGTQESPNGLFYKFEYTFNDGSTISARHKTETAPFGPGDTVEVTVRGESQVGPYGAVGRPQQPQGAFKPPTQSRGGADRQVQITNQWAIREAQTYLQITGAHPDRITMYDVALHARQFVLMANDIEAYVNSERQNNEKL